MRKADLSPHDASPDALYVRIIAIYPLSAWYPHREKLEGKVVRVDRILHRYNHGYVKGFFWLTEDFPMAINGVKIEEVEKED